MPQVDRLGFRRRKKIFLPYRGASAHGLAGFEGASGVGVSVGAGDAPEAEAASTDAVGLNMDPTTDAHNWYWMLPYDLDVLHPINFRVRYSCASFDSADDRHWVLLYDIIPTGTVFAIGSTALSTAIVAETDNGVADAYQDSPQGVLDGNIVTAAQVTAQHYMALNLVLLLEDASEEMNMFGLRVSYMPQRYQGKPGNYNDPDTS